MNNPQTSYSLSTSGPQPGMIKKVKKFVTERWTLGPIHGPKHWANVARNGELLAAETGANVLVTQLFALLHDVGRIDDDDDPDHGRRSAQLAVEIRFTLLKNLTAQEFTQLHAACEGHAALRKYGDPTIDTCFDADRLDLVRFGMTLNPCMMATEAGRRMAQERMVQESR